MIKKFSLKLGLKNILRNSFNNIFLILNKFKFFKLITKKVYNLYLVDEGYVTDWKFLIEKSPNNLFLGENIFIKKFDKLNIINCIDIGANVGEYSTQILLNKKSRVIAFEPIPKCCKELALIEKNNNRFKYYRNALSDKERLDFIFLEKKTVVQRLQKL